MKSFVVVLACLIVLGYVWREQLFDKLHSTIFAGPKEASRECVVEDIECEALVRMLNALRPGRYYDGASQLLGVDAQENTMRRDGKVMAFALDDGMTVYHNQGVVNSEKGYMTVKFPDGHWQKYDATGKFVSEGH